MEHGEKESAWQSLKKVIFIFNHPNPPPSFTWLEASIDSGFFFQDFSPAPVCSVSSSFLTMMQEEQEIMNLVVWINCLPAITTARRRLRHRRRGPFRPLKKSGRKWNLSETSHRYQTSEKNQKPGEIVCYKLAAVCWGYPESSKCGCLAFEEWRVENLTEWKNKIYRKILAWSVRGCDLVENWSAKRGEFLSSPIPISKRQWQKLPSITPTATRTAWEFVENKVNKIYLHNSLTTNAYLMSVRGGLPVQCWLM